MVVFFAIFAGFENFAIERDDKTMERTWQRTLAEHS
jgi:hypothetical protein